MANHSYNMADRGDRTALCKLGLKFHEQFFSALHQQGVCKKTQTATLHSPSTVVVLHTAMAAQVTN